jgi:hypothetical protein
MRKLIFAFFLLCLSFNSSFAQDKAELVILKTLLGVPTETPVAFVSNGSLPDSEPLKLYLDVSGDTPERDKKVKDNFAAWVEEWNKGEDAKFGMLEIVPEYAQAHVALVHFTDFPAELEDNGANAPAEVNTATGQPDNSLLISNTIKMSMVVYSYLVVKESDSLKGLFRRKEPVINKSSVVVSSRQTTQVRARLRKDIDKEIDKRALKSQGQKDAKRSDYRLRDELFNLMRSRSRAVKNQ